MTIAMTEPKADLLRLITCGSVDHGKSTLIGRLLHDSQVLSDDVRQALETVSRVHGTVAGGIDYALVLDGLEAEIEQGITIDVAYRFFTLRQRRFIVADSPGHEQYTRNMATAASTADLALIVIDAQDGVLTQTRRHSYIFSLFGIKDVLLAVNKMDLVGYDAKPFAEIARSYINLAEQLGVSRVQCIPISALHGDNVVTSSTIMSWYDGPTVVDYLASVQLEDKIGCEPLRIPVQHVARPDSTFRGYSGLIASGTVRRGEAVTVQPSGRSSSIEQIMTADGQFDDAIAGQSVTLTLADDVDVSRGDVICAGKAPFVADQFAAHLLWIDDAALLPGRQYLMKAGTKTMRASVSALRHRINVNTFEHQAATTLHLNEIGYVHLTTDRPAVLDAYANLRETGSFILVDPISYNTAGAGVIDFALRRATTIRWQDLDIDRARRAQLNAQHPCVLWFTGLSGAGKSTIANFVEKRLVDLGRRTYLLDGDNVRHGLNKDLGFTAEARVENVRRVGEVAKLFVDAGLIILASLISPFRAERDMVRMMLDPGDFIEIFVSTPLEECERRDPKGLYRRARAGEIPNFTGIDSPYETPTTPELTIDTSELSRDEATDQIISYLQKQSFI